MKTSHQLILAFATLLLSFISAKAQQTPPQHKNDTTHRYNHVDTVRKLPPPDSVKYPKTKKSPPPSETKSIPTNDTTYRRPKVGHADTMLEKGIPPRDGGGK